MSAGKEATQDEAITRLQFKLQVIKSNKSTYLVHSELLVCLTSVYHIVNAVLNKTKFNAIKCKKLLVS